MALSTTFLEQELDKAAHEERYLSVIYLCLELLKLNPEEFSHWYDLAEAYHSLGRFDDFSYAQDQAQRYSSEKELPWIICRKGNLLYSTGRFEEAISCFRRANSLFPDDATFLIYMASANFRKNDVVEAETLARKAIECEKGAVDEAHYNLGCYLIAQDKLAEAKEHIKKALSIDPDYEEAKERLHDLEEFQKLSINKENTDRS